MTVGDARFRHTIQTHQRGIGRAGVVIGLLVVLAAGLIGLTFKNDNVTAPAPPIDPSVQSAINKARCVYHDANLCKFFAVQAVQAPYTATTTTRINGRTTITVLKKQTDDTYYLRSDSSDPPSEIINIGMTRYTKTAEGSWQKSQVTTDETIANIASIDPVLPEPVEYNDGTRATYRFVRAEPCGASTCLHYTLSDPASPGTSRLLWFTKDDYRLYRLQTTASGTRTDTYYDLAAVSIAAPSPLAAAPTPPPPSALVQTGDTLPRTGDD